MGGAVAVHTAVQGYLPSLAGLVVIDVVEGDPLCAHGIQYILLACTVRWRGSCAIP